MEVGVADGRFSEHFLSDARPKTWYMVEPFPNKCFRPAIRRQRAGAACRGASSKRC